MVRLRLFILSPLGIPFLSFNPTMVRLRRARLGPVHIADLHFADLHFQSHYGAIATPRGGSIGGRRCSFNPTMVRLRRKTSAQFWLNSLRLSIPLWCDCDPWWLSFLVIYLGIVSIPLWCDCDWRRRYCSCAQKAVSIPLWCDCDPRRY